MSTIFLSKIVEKGKNNGLYHYYRFQNPISSTFSWNLFDFADITLKMSGHSPQIFGNPWFCEGRKLGISKILCFTCKKHFCCDTQALDVKTVILHHNNWFPTAQEFPGPTTRALFSLLYNLGHNILDFSQPSYKWSDKHHNYKPWFRVIFW